MTVREKLINTIILSIVVSVINWIIIDKLILKMSIFQYFFVEIFLLLSLKTYIFAKRKLDLL